jgi:arylsulfatase A-like enzyme
LRRRFKKLILWFAIIIIIGAGGWYFFLRSDALPPRIIILIVADTLRADHMGCYGYPKKTTPSLDRFAEDCVIFDRAYSPIPATLPAHMSILTGFYPDAHRAAKDKSRALSPEIATLTEKIKEAGYNTTGFVSSILLKGDIGFQRGFDDYRLVDENLTFADRLNSLAIEWLNQTATNSDSKAFLFIHYYDVHSDFFRSFENKLPYYAPKEFIEIFCPHPELSLANDHQVDSYASQYLIDLTKQRIRVSEPARESIAGLYDAGVAYFDDQLGELFSRLKEKGIYEDSLIILTADHGEELQEHGEFLHNQTYEETIRVPLLIKFPRGQFTPGRKDNPVGLIDIMPTLLEYLKIPMRKGVQGESFLAMVQDGIEDEREIFSKGNAIHGWKFYSLTGKRYKLIYNETTGEKELYDLEKDYGETTNVADQHPDLTDKLTERIQEIIQTNATLARKFQKGSAKKPFSPEEIKKLKALGYLGD